MSDDTWWIEFMEDEVEPSLRQDMEKILVESSADQVSLENMARLRLWTKESDPVEDLWRPGKWDLMHDKIMNKISQLEEVNVQPRGLLPPPLTEVCEVAASPVVVKPLNLLA